MKFLSVLPLSFLILLKFQQIFATQDENFDHLYAASNHGHETGMANKEKRCFAAKPQWRMRQYPSILGSAHNPNHLQPSLPSSREAAINSCNACKQTFCKVDKLCNFCRQVCHNAPINERSADDRVLMASRFKPEEDRDGRMSEEQERYYTVGAFSQGPRQQILAKMLNIPPSVQLDRLIILAKNKSKNKPPAVPHPVVIDTAHVFTRNSGIPSELDLELHDIKNDATQGDISKLTSQLNKELDAAIETKKHMLRDSHLTPQEIDKIIEHVVEQLNKKLPAPPTTSGKDIVGDVGPETRIAEDDDERESFKKQKQDSKKHQILAGDEEFVGDERHDNNQQFDDGELLEHTLSEKHPEHPEFDEIDKTPLHSGMHQQVGMNEGHFETLDNIALKEGLEDGTILGHKKFKKFHKKSGNNGGYHSNSYYRGKENEGDDRDDQFQNEQVGQSYPSYSTGHQQHRPQNIYQGYQGANEQKEGYPGPNGEYQDTYPVYEPEHVEPETYHKENQYENNYQQQSEGYLGPLSETQEYVKPAGMQYPTNPEPQYEQEQYESIKPTHYPMTIEPIYVQNEQGEEYQPQKLNHQLYHSPAMSNYEPPSASYQQPTYQHSAPTNQQEHIIYQRPYAHRTYKQLPSSYNPHSQNMEQYAYQSKPVQPSNSYSEPNYRSAPEQTVKANEESPKTHDADAKSKEGKIEESSVGKNKEPHEEATSKPNWFETEYHKLRKWISDNAPLGRTAKPETEDNNGKDKDAIVDEFTKVIEHDLTEGQKLSSSEMESLDKKIAKVVRDNINSENPSTADKQAEKKLDQLEDLVEEETKDGSSKEERTSALDKLKSRFSQDGEGLTAKEHVDKLKKQLRTSLESLKKEHDSRTTVKPQREQKPLIDLQHIVGDIQAMPNKLMEGADKLAEIMNSKTEKTVPLLGQRSGDSNTDTNTEPTVGQAKDTTKNDETVGKFFDFKGKKEKGGSGEWHIIPYNEYGHYGPRPYHYYHGYDDSYRNAEPQAQQPAEQSAKTGTEEKIMHNLDKLIHPASMTNPQTAFPQQRPSAVARSNEAEESPLQEMIEELQDNLHLPKLPPLPSLLPTNRHAVAKSPVPQIQVNNAPLSPDFVQDLRPTLPEMVPMQPPQFQQRSNANQQFADPSQFQTSSQFQFQHEPFVGAMPQHPRAPPTMNPPHDFTKFGRLVPEAVHDMHKRDLSTPAAEGKKRMYFVGDGIRLPLHMHKHADGTLHLSVDLQKLCKCNMTSCAPNNAAVIEPEAKGQNVVVGSKHSKSSQDISMDIGDVPLQMVPPHLDVPNNAIEEGIRVRRSPKFNHYDGQDPVTSSQPAHDDEGSDYTNHIKKGLLESVEKKMDDFNNDMKEYYDNEAIIKQARSDRENVDGYLEKRVGLLGKILNWMKDIAFEE